MSTQRANVVLGAGGPTGLECVKRLLAVTELPVRAVVREPEKYKDTLPASDKLQVVKGDVTDASSLTAAFQGAEGIIFAASGKGFWSAKSVDFLGVANVASAAKAAGAKQVILVSSMLTTPKNRLHPIRILLNNIRWSLMDRKFDGEQALRSSGVPYTVVRPSGLSKGPAGESELISGQGDTMRGGGSISRADVAAVCVEALTNPAAKNVTVEITSKPGLKGTLAEELKKVFEGKQTDEVLKSGKKTEL